MSVGSFCRGTAVQYDDVDDDDDDDDDDDNDGNDDDGRYAVPLWRGFIFQSRITSRPNKQV